MDSSDGSKTTPPAESSWARQVARASVMAPVIAVGVHVMTFAMPRESRMVTSFVGTGLILAGLVCAIIGLASVWTYGRKGILVSSIIGLLINALLIVSAVFTWHMPLGFAWSRVASVTLLANGRPVAIAGRVLSPQEKAALFQAGSEAEKIK